MSVKRLFERLASRGNLPGLPGTIDGVTDILTRAYYDVPAIMPGTSVGAFAINDIVNRMLARGATPRFLGATFAVSPDMSAITTRYVASHTAEAAVEAEVEIISSHAVDLDKGQQPGLAVTLTAVGEMWPPALAETRPVRPGDAVIITGRAGAHGVALYEARTRSLFIPPVLSDSASLCDVINALRRVVAEQMRLMCYPADGVIDAMAHIESVTGCKVRLDADAVPIAATVSDAARVMHRQALTLPTAGAMIAVVPEEMAEEAIEAVRREAHGSHAAVIGRII